MPSEAQIDTSTAPVALNASKEPLNATRAFPGAEFALLLLAALARVASSGSLKSLASGTILFTAFRLGRSAVGKRHLVSTTGSGWAFWLRRPKLALIRLVERVDDKIMDARLARISASEGSKKSGTDSLDAKNVLSTPAAAQLSAKAVSELLGDSISTDPSNDSVVRALDPRPTSAPKKKKKPRDTEPEEVGIERSVSEPGPVEGPVEVKSGEYRMALLVRTDLGMGKGKAAAQCAHAALSSYKSLLCSNPELLLAWEASGSPKIVLKVENEAELLSRMAKARERGLVAKSILDAGRTQIAAGSRTVAALGPGLAEDLETVCKGLKLF